MKKIIAISVMFVLLTGAVFAVDIGGTVIGTTTVLQGNNDPDAKVTSDFSMNRIRFEGYGETDEGLFGGWIRLGDGGTPSFNGYAFWKPMEQVKLIIGGQPDGFWGKEGVTGWGFYQTAYDTDVVIGGNVWGWGPADPSFWAGMPGFTFDGGDLNMYGHPAKFRNAFYGGQGKDALMLEITPADIVQINVAIPADEHSGEETANVFQFATVQLDIKLDVGNIAITYKGGISKEASSSGPAIDEPGALYAYFGGSFGAISLDVGLGYYMAGLDKAAKPIWVGAGVKYAADSFGVKARFLAGLAGDDKVTRVLVDVLPYFILSDSMRAYVSAGVGMLMPDGGDSWTDFHFNPYLEVGQEWGSKFLAGIKYWSEYNGEITNWAIPVALIVSF